MSQFQHNQQNNNLVQDDGRKRSHRWRIKWRRRNEAAIKMDKMVKNFQQALDENVVSSSDSSTTDDERMEESTELSVGNESSPEFSGGNQNISKVKSSDQLPMNKPKGVEYFQIAGCSSSDNMNNTKTPEKENPDFETPSLSLPVFPLKLGTNQKSLPEYKRKRPNTDFLNEQLVRIKKIAKFSEESSVVQAVTKAVLQLASKETVQKDVYLENAERKKSSVEEEKKLYEEKIAKMNNKLNELNAKKMKDMEETNKYLLELQSLSELKETMAQEKIHKLTQENEQLLIQYQYSLEMIQQNQTETINRKQKLIQYLQQEVKNLNHILNERSNQFETDLKRRETEVKKKNTELEEYKANLKKREEELNREKKNHDQLKALYRQLLENQAPPESELLNEIQIKSEPFDLEDTQAEILTENIIVQEVFPDADNSAENMDNIENQISVLKKQIDFDTMETEPDV